MTTRAWVLALLLLGPTSVWAQPTALPVIICPPSICRPAAQGAADAFAIGKEVRATTLLNVRECAGLLCKTAGPAQVTGAFGIITDGPTVIAGQTWWKIDYACCTDGWSSEAFLKVEALDAKPTVEILIKLPSCAKDTPPCVKSEVILVPVPTP